MYETREKDKQVKSAFNPTTKYITPTNSTLASTLNKNGQVM